MISMNSVINSFESLSEIDKKNSFIDPRFDNNKNKSILEATLNYIQVFARFSGSFFEQ